MGISTVVIAVFIVASLGLSWVSGDKEQERLHDRVAKRGVETRDVERELGDKNRQFARQSSELTKVKAKLKKELRAKKKVERKLSYEKRQRRLALERQEELGGTEEKTVEAPASGRQQVTKRTYERVDREKIRAEIEKKVKQEISELEAKLRAVEESSRRLEAEMQLRIEEEARKRAEEAWTQAELARVRAEEAAAESLVLKDRLEKVKKVKEAVEIALSEQEDALIRVEERLASERVERERLEERLEGVEEAFEVSRLAGEEAIEEASFAISAAEKATSTVITPEEVAESAREISRLDSARSAAEHELVAKSEEIDLLKSRILEIKAEKEVVFEEAFKNSSKLIELKQQLETANLKESELRDIIEEQKAAYMAKLESAALEKEKSLKAAHDVVVSELEVELNSASRKLSEAIAEIPVLQAEVNSARDKETELGVALETLKSAQGAELAKALDEQKSLLEVGYGARSAEYEALLARAGVKSVEALTALQAEVNSAQSKETELGVALETLKSAQGAELAKALGEQEVALKASYGVKIAELEGKFADASIAKLEASSALQTEVARLKERSAELEAQNGELSLMLNESRIALAEASAEREIAKELIVKNVALEAKLKEAGLANLQGKAADYVAQKLIERNADLESKLQVARLGLAKSEAARARASQLTEENNTLVSKLRNAEVSLAAFKASSGVLAQVTERNSELEQKIVEAEAALAQADATRFMVEELNSKNVELSEMLAREREAGSDGSEIEAKLRNINAALEQKLKEERGVRGSMEVKLVEAIAAKNAGENAIDDLVRLQSSAEQSVSREVEVRKAVEQNLAQTELKLSLSEKSVASAVKAMQEAEELLFQIRSAETAGESMVEQSTIDAMVALEVANKGRIELEAKLKTQMESGRIVEAKLREFEETVGQQRVKIESLEQAVNDAELRLEGKVNTRDDIKAEIRSVGAKARSLSAESGSEMTLAVLQYEFTQLKGKIRQKLESGEIEAAELVDLMRVDNVLDMHIVSKGDTLWGIASNKDLYANPYMWPLIYRYNVTKLRNPDRIEPGQVLIIFKDVSEVEAKDAVKKAKYRGDWKKWSATQKKSWVKEWTRH